MSLLRTAIGTVLRRVRQRQGRTLQDVADAAGVSMPYLSEIERGRKEASSEILAVICRALGLTLPDLLEEVRSELLKGNPAVVPPRCSAVGRSAPSRLAGRWSTRLARLVTCRPRTPVSSSSTNF